MEQGNRNANDQGSGAAQAAQSFMSFLNRSGGGRTDLASALQYQAAQAKSGTQEITTPHQEAMEAWAARLAAERREKERELATLLKKPGPGN